MIAVAKRGSAKIITPAADWMQVRAGARADDEEERVLDLAVQPDDAGQPAEHLALAALAQHRRVRAAVARPAGSGRSALIAGTATNRRRRRRGAASQARRAQLQHELGGVDDVGRVGGEREQHQLRAGPAQPVSSATR